MPVTHVVQPTIFTPRLELHHLSGDRLFTLFEDPENESIYEGRSYSNPHRELVDNQGPLHWRVPQVKHDAAANKWFVRWMVLRSTREIVGSISFHAPPNPEGMVEIGLGVNPSFQGRGYAKEALLGMWSWAVEQPGVRVLRYTVSASNIASITIIEHFGFTHTGVQIDEQDGPEEVFEMTASEFTQSLVTTWRGP